MITGLVATLMPVAGDWGCYFGLTGVVLSYSALLAKQLETVQSAGTVTATSVARASRIVRTVAVTFVRAASLPSTSRSPLLTTSLL